MSNIEEKQYLDIAQKILNEGKKRIDRTKVGTQSIFDTNMVFDISKSFPLLTTKKVWFKGIVEELLWFLSGDTNIRILQEKGVHIWDEWASPSGALGPVYGKQWRRWEKLEIFERRETPYCSFSPQKDKLHGYGYNYNHSIEKDDIQLYVIWQDLLKNISQDNYVSMDPAWFDFQVFSSEVKKLENWNLKKMFPDKYFLDPNYYGSMFFGPCFSRWSSAAEMKANKDNEYYQASKGEKIIQFKDLDYFCSNYGVDVFQARNRVECWQSYFGGGFVIKKIALSPKLIARVKIIDQIDRVIAQIKNDPDSRRILFSAWNVGELDEMALPPCHMMMQFYVDDENKQLSGKLTQRSVDWFLGCPYNIASYAALIQLIATHLDMSPGKLVFSGGDSHLYLNHFSQMKEQISREPFAFPKLKIKKQKRIEDYRVEHFVLEDYCSHAKLVGDIAI